MPPDEGQRDETPGVSTRNTLNDLTAKEWLSESVSVWNQRGLGAGHSEAKIERLHPAPFSFTDVARLIKMFTKKGMVVLDPFVGVGSTLKACALEHRNGIGFELNPDFVDLAERRLQTEIPKEVQSLTTQELFVGDARVLTAKIDRESMDFIVTSPPYWGILGKVDHKATQERVARGLATDYGVDPADLANIASYDEFVDELGSVLGGCAQLLKPKRYMALVVGDFRHKSRYHMFHADIAERLEREGLTLQAVNVLYQRHKRVFPYGYPSAYVSNVHHQFIVVLRKLG